MERLSVSVRTSRTSDRPTGQVVRRGVSLPACRTRAALVLLTLGAVACAGGRTALTESAEEPAESGPAGSVETGSDATAPGATTPSPTDATPSTEPGATTSTPTDSVPS